MLIVEQSSVDLLVKYMKEKKKRNSFYFSSLRALKQSRMNTKKLVSKISQSTPGKLRKSLCFGREGTVEEEAIVARNVGPLQEMLEDKCKLDYTIVDCHNLYFPSYNFIFEN